MTQNEWYAVGAQKWQEAETIKRGGKPAVDFDQIEADLELTDEEWRLKHGLK